MMIAFYDPFVVALFYNRSDPRLTYSSVDQLGLRKRVHVGGYAGCLACYGGIVMGGSIWSMHFIAMLALHLPVSISYDPWRTALSLALPIVVTGLSLRIVSREMLGRWSIPVSGLLMGLAISGMHYLGMSAIRGCSVDHHTPGVLLAIAIAIGAATVALWFVFRKRNALETAVGAVVLGLAISGMHYTAMLATILPLSTRSSSSPFAHGSGHARLRDWRCNGGHLLDQLRRRHFRGAGNSAARVMGAARRAHNRRSPRGDRLRVCLWPE